VAIFLDYVIGAEHSEMAVLCCGWVMVLNFRGFNAQRAATARYTKATIEGGRKGCVRANARAARVARCAPHHWDSRNKKAKNPAATRG
jgi:hypothetical protein